MSPMSPIFLMSLLFLLMGPAPSNAQGPIAKIAQFFALHSITIETPTPLSCLAWDPIGKHFIAGSTQGPALYAIYDNGIAEYLLSEMNNTGYFVESVVVDHVGHRLIVAFSVPSSVAAYDLKTYRKISELPLPQLDGAPGGVAVDLKNGDVFVTSKGRGIVLKVRLDRYETLLSEFKVTEDQGLGSIVHVNDDHNSYLLVVQATTGKIFNVASQDGTVKEVLPIGESQIPATKGHTIALHSDLSLTFVGEHASIRLIAIFGKMSRSAFYYDRSLKQHGQAISATVQDGKKAYVLIESPMTMSYSSASYSIVEMDWERMWIFDVMIYVAVLQVTFITLILSFGIPIALYVERIRPFHNMEC